MTSTPAERSLAGIRLSNRIIVLAGSDVYSAEGSVSEYEKARVAAGTIGTCWRRSDRSSCSTPRNSMPPPWPLMFITVGWVPHR